MFQSFVFFLVLTQFHQTDAQGLNFEKGYNRDFNQEVQNVTCHEEYTYLTHSLNTSSFVTHAVMTKLDTNNDEMWSQYLPPYFLESKEVNDVMVVKDQGIFTTGTGRQTCDVVGGKTFFVTKLTEDGEESWTTSWHDSYSNIHFEGYPSGLSYTANQQIIVQKNAYFTQNETSILTLSPDGSLLDSINIDEKDFQGFEQFGQNHFIAFKENSIWRYALDEELTEARVFSNPIKSFQVREGTLYLLTTSSIHTLDENLNIISEKFFEDNQSLSKLKIDNEKIRFLNSYSLGQSIYTLNLQFDLIDSTQVLFHDENEVDHDFSESHYARGITFPLSEEHAIRLLDFSLTKTVDNEVNSTDIELLDLKILDFERISPPSGNDYILSEIEILIKNKGNNVLDSALINRNLGWGECNTAHSRLLAKDLSIASGDSAWVYRGWTSRDVFGQPSGDMIHYCFYTSYPNGVTDLNPDNDRLCKTLSLYPVAVETVNTSKINIYPNPAITAWNIENLPAGEYNYEVYNAFGHLISKDKLYNTGISITHFPSGVYYLNILDRSAEHIHSTLAIKL